MSDKYFPKDDVILLIQLMRNTRLSFYKSKAHKYRYKYIKQLCKSIIKDFQEEKDYENVNVFKDLLKDIKKYKWTDDGRFFRDIKYNYYYLDKLYKLGVFEQVEENENEICN